MLRRLRLWAFHALYYQFAWAYDWVSRVFFRGQWWLWQQTPLPHLKGQHILELGPGTGRLFVEMLRDGYSVFGLELSPAMLRLSQRRLRRAEPSLRTRALLLRGSAMAIPLADASIDTVVATFPTDYIIHPQTLAETRRVLRPGGRLIVVPTAQLTQRDAVETLVQRAAYGNQDPNGPFFYLDDRMSEAGYTVRTVMWGNNVGAAMILIGDKPDIPQH